MLQRILMCAAAVAASLGADTVVMRTGRTVEGSYLGGDSRRVRIAVGDRVETIGVDEISEIKFGSTEAASAAVTPPAQRTDISNGQSATTIPARGAAGA